MGESLRSGVGSGDGIVLVAFPLGGVALKLFVPVRAFHRLDAHNIAVGLCPTGDAGGWRCDLCGDVDGGGAWSWVAACPSDVEGFGSPMDVPMFVPRCDREVGAACGGAHAAATTP